MCIECAVPTIPKFLGFFPLKCGSAIICIWTLFRALLCSFFFSQVILEVFIRKHYIICKIFVSQTPTYEDAYGRSIYYAFLILLVAECMLVVACLHLAAGLITRSQHSLLVFLKYRRIIWLYEVALLPILCFIHSLLRAWYFVMVMCVLLEFYSVMVVYSYLSSLKKADASSECDARTKSCICNNSRV